MDDKILKKIELLSHILFIEYKGNLIKYNDTELYHDIHRALISKDYTKELLKRANKYWNLFKNIGVDEFLEMIGQVDNETDADDSDWYISLLKLLLKDYENPITIKRGLAKYKIIQILTERNNKKNS